MEQDVVKHYNSFHALHLLSVDSVDHKMVSLITLDQRICCHDFLKETLLAAKSREDTHNAKAVQEMKVLCTLQKSIDLFRLQLENLNNFLVTLFYLVFQNMDRVRQILLRIRSCATQTII